MSRALSLPNGLAMPTRDSTGFPSTLTTKFPLAGFSALMVTLAMPLSPSSILAARVLNAFQLLHASMDISGREELGDEAGGEERAAVVSFVLDAGFLAAAAFFLGDAAFLAILQGEINDPTDSDPRAVSVRFRSPTCR